MRPPLRIRLAPPVACTMRQPAVFVVLLAAAALVALLVAGRRDRGEPEPGRILLLGDSLNVGIEPYLEDVLPGWKVVPASRVGMPTSEAGDLLVRGIDDQAPHVIVSLGTNDSPDDVRAFRREVRRVLRAIGPNRCVAWATIWRGGPSPAFDQVLRDAAAAGPRVRLVEWARMVGEHPELLASDGVHATEDGYRARARAVADVVRSCVPARELRAP